LNSKAADKKIPEEQVEYPIAVRQQKQNEAADYEPFDPSVHLDPSWE
jgi:phosphoribosyl-ATP pyrophosphohydrolase